MRLIRIEEIEGKNVIYKLEENGTCYFDEFCEQIKGEGNIAKELDRVQSILDDVANLLSLPQKKFKDITPDKEKIKEYEVKTRNLRIYLIKFPENGKCILIGGKKNSQKKDINYFRSIKKRVLENLESK